ncbi:protein BREAST CANCER SUSCEPTIBILITY 2 homolog B [Euphorbia lathyris]|uniref:protein BREAST CANCER SUSCEPTIBILITY 2 homolog B n=1 Tax=Euphorbia lathyris TaxID=212925 RepID=UPI00331420C1
MSTWQMFSDTGTNFRWEVSGRAFRGKREDAPNAAAIQPFSSGTRLPSMADLLLQGCSKLAENDNEDVGRAPMFRTGLGKSVALKQSSIARALSVLGDNDDVAISSGENRATDNVSGVTNSLFCTGSGKSVIVSSSGLVRAKTLLGLKESNSVLGNQAFNHPRNLLDSSDGGQDFLHLRVPEDMTNSEMGDAVSVSGQFINFKPSLEGSNLSNIVNPNAFQSEIQNSTSILPPIKFQTAGGRSLSVSSDALERAKSLLGGPDVGSFLNEEDRVDTSLSVFNVNKSNDTSSHKAANFRSFTYPGAAKSKHISKSFVPPLRSTGNQNDSSLNSENIISGVDLINKFDAVDDDKICGLNSTVLSKKRSLSYGPCHRDIVEDYSLGNGMDSSRSPLPRSSCGPLVDISNTIGAHTHTNQRQSNSERKRFGRGASISSFKKPRTSKFTTPLKRNLSYTPSGLYSPSESHCCRRKISTRYPFPIHRIYIKEYFQVPSIDRSMLDHMNDSRCIKSDSAEKYTFYDESGWNCIGASALYDMLVQSGASVQYASKEWVTNHYKWIVWKLSCYERLKSHTRFLTVSNVLEELKYRYEREVNHGHSSAIKRISEGDAQASSMLILCISGIRISYEPKTETLPLNESGNNSTGKVELTDGWYSIDAILDVPLSKQLAAGKLFVGQKLRIWGAGLCGWVGPVSPLEVLASRTITLLLHINGTYRAHWADRLGFCKGAGPPLAFRCIKSNGGYVPRTLIGVTRLYPVLYKEKLSNGGSIVRSERMEAKAIQFYNQRRCAVIEGIVSDFQRGMKASYIYNDTDSEEGAKILKILETAAEPEVIMAEMSPEQLTSFASYQAKLEATKQLDMEKAVKKALQEACLEEREVTPFMRVRVVGLCNYQGKDIPTKEGLITIWSPTEKQKSELVEGQAYAIAGLLPVNSDSNTLYLQARGSTMKLKPLVPLEIQHFQPFFSPRVPVLLPNLGEVPLSSEFDTAAYVIYVGEVCTTTQWKKQWVFVTDGSFSTLKWEEISDSLLAISFCSPLTDEDSFTPINFNLAGSIVGFFNLIKKAKDRMNHLWIAEATENSVYSLSFDSPNCLHLRTCAASVQSWAKSSSLMIDKLKEKVLYMVGDIKARS